MTMGEGPLPRKSLAFGRIAVNVTILRRLVVAELLSTVYQFSWVRSSHRVLRDVHHYSCLQHQVVTQLPPHPSPHPWLPGGMATPFAARSKMCVCVCVCLGASQSTKEVWGKRLNSSADCGADQELPIAKFRLKLKKVGRTTRLRYDLSWSPYDYRVEVTNRVKGLDLVDREPEERWAEVHDVVQGQESRLPPRKRNSTKQKGCWRGPYK